MSVRIFYIRSLCCDMTNDRVLCAMGIEMEHDFDYIAQKNNGQRMIEMKEMQSITAHHASLLHSRTCCVEICEMITLSVISTYFVMRYLIGWIPSEIGRLLRCN